MATRTVQCPICKEDLRDPRLLPCVHWFCLECLEGYCRDKLPGDDVPCPVCRNEFQIPKNGFADLPLRAHAKEPTPSVMCEVCSNIPATVYCKVCSQKLCGNCGIPHRKMRGGSHDVIPLEPVAPELSKGRYCEKHEDERIKMYCFDCNMNMCPMCCLETHKTHTFERIETVVEQFSRSIDDEVDLLTSRIECFHGAAAQVEAENNKTLDNVKEIELEMEKRCRQIKQIVDLKASILLKSLKSAAEKEVKPHRDILQLALTELESFRTSSLELRSNGLPSDITQATNNVCLRANELLQTYVVPAEFHAPSYKFIPGNIDEFRGDSPNFIGQVVKVVHPGCCLILLLSSWLCMLVMSICFSLLWPRPM